MGQYIAGTKVRLYAVFTTGKSPARRRVPFSDGYELNVVGFITDPSTVDLKLRIERHGAITEHTFPGGDGVIVKDAAGMYYADVIPTIAGIWLVQWATAGSLVTVNEEEFRVVPSSF